MNSDSEAASGHSTSSLRAGFWRRFSALILDFLLVAVPVQIVVAIAFSLTGGAVQTQFGVHFTACNVVEALPAGVELPNDYDEFKTCTVSLLGMPNAKFFSAQKNTKDGETYTVTFPLKADGTPRDVTDVSWMATLALFLYLVLMEAHRGTTFGKRQLGIRVYDIDDLGRMRIGFVKAAKRKLIMVSPVIFLLCLSTVLAPESLAELERSLFNPIPWIFFAMTMLFYIWIIVSVVRMVDPIYDRLAGTTVRRVDGK
ncbi:MAG: RDD family protein [Mesorhizobium sp.]